MSIGATTAAATSTAVTSTTSTVSNLSTTIPSIKAVAQFLTNLGLRDLHIKNDCGNFPWDVEKMISHMNELNKNLFNGDTQKAQEWVRANWDQLTNEMNELFNLTQPKAKR